MEKKQNSKYHDEKVRRLIQQNKVLIESISPRFIFFKVEGDNDDYSVKKVNGKNEWSCTCMHGTYNIIKNAVCSHIDACDTLLGMVDIDHPDYNPDIEENDERRRKDTT